MIRTLRFLAVAAATLAAGCVGAAEIVRLSPTNGAVALGAVTSPGIFTVTDVAGRRRAGITVRFDEHCGSLVRGEPPPYACVSALPGEALERVSDAQGQVTAPVYRANNTNGTAWLSATMSLDGETVSVPFVYLVGAGSRNPIQLIAGDRQQVQVGAPLVDALVVRVIDDRGLPVAGVPMDFASTCTLAGTPQPCLADLAPERGFTDASGLFRSNLATAQTAGEHRVAVLMRGGTFANEFRITNYLPRRLAVEPLKQLGLRLMDAPAACSIDLFEVEPIAPLGKPRMLAIPHGIVHVKIGGCPAGATLKLQFLHPGGFPEGAKVWSASPEWKALDTVNPVEGTSEFTLVEGGLGDIDAVANGRIEAYLGMGYGDPDNTSFQDLWWSGPSGNGWGVSIIQHGQVLFPVFFVYDAAGGPTWYVMPAGRWNAAHDEYSGALYSPRGRPLSVHRSSDLVAGTPPGRATLRFRDALTMEVDVELPGASVRLPLVRQIFGPLVPGPTPRYADMWWPGAARDGWGLVLQQQYMTVFALLFTYREDGKPTWVVMPSAYWSDSTTLLGNAFSTKSSSWPLEYDAARLTSQQVGAFSLRFGGGRLTFDFTSPARAERYELTPLPF